MAISRSDQRPLPHLRLHGLSARGDLDLDDLTVGEAELQALHGTTVPLRGRERDPALDRLLDRGHADRSAGKLDLPIDEDGALPSPAAEASPFWRLTGRSPMRNRRSVPSGVVMRVSLPRRAPSKRRCRRPPVVGLEQAR